MLTLNRELNGKILDIGGGGEGVIGRLYTNQVVAIDIRQDELDEAPTGFEKIMFMSAEDQKRAISEAARVLVNGGEVHIWDCDIL